MAVQIYCCRIPRAKRLWEEVEALRVEQDRLRRHAASSFIELKHALCATFEMYAASYLELILEEIGYPSTVVE